MKESKTRNLPSFWCIFVFILLQSCAPSPTHFAMAAESPIKNIVVLIMENRSFDHMLGWMKKSINPSINGVTGKECNPISTNQTSSQTICFKDDAEYVDPDPGHTYEAVLKQVYGSGSTPTMTGFVEQALSMSKNLSETVMKGFRPEAIPVYTSLVQEFAVFDRWFSSIPGPTQPNRLFAYSASCYGSLHNDPKQIASGYPQKTIFDSLHENGMNFGIYYQSIPSTLLYKSLRKLKHVRNFHRFSVAFKRDAKKGKLPSLTVIEPRFFDIIKSPANDDHPSHDVANGQKLVKEVYETLRASPQWNQTLFVITYDEHGGFYDHVQTPYVNIPNPDGKIGPAPHSFKFDRIGVRVPTIMVSPWIKKGTLVSGAKGPTPNSEYEHSSIPATIKKIFNLKSNFLNHRDAWAGTFEGIVGELTSPRTDCPVTLPEVVPLRKTQPNENREVSEFQQELLQLASVLKGDHHLNNFLTGEGKKMSVKEASDYVNGATTRFMASDN